MKSVPNSFKKKINKYISSVDLGSRGLNCHTWGLETLFEIWHIYREILGINK